VPPAPLLAALAADATFRWARARRWRPLLAGALFLAVAYPVVYADVVVDRTSIRHYNLGERHMAVSFEHQRRAVALSEAGDEAGARQALADVLAERVLAEQAYLHGLRDAPRSRRLNEGLRDLWTVQITTLQRLGRTDEALVVADRLAARYPSYGPGHAWRATLLADQGRSDEARDAARRALEIDPGDERAQRALRRAGTAEEP
jgi:tetratricopeptide (TPR) repeat protein